MVLLPETLLHRHVKWGLPGREHPHINNNKTRKQPQIRVHKNSRVSYDNDDGKPWRSPGGWGLDPPVSKVTRAPCGTCPPHGKEDLFIVRVWYQYIYKIILTFWNHKTAIQIIFPEGKKISDIKFQNICRPIYEIKSQSKDLNSNLLSTFICLWSWPVFLCEKATGQVESKWPGQQNLGAPAELPGPWPRPPES